MASAARPQVLHLHRLLLAVARINLKLHTAALHLSTPGVFCLHSTALHCLPPHLSRVSLDFLLGPCPSRVSSRRSRSRSRRRSERISSRLRRSSRSCGGRTQQQAHHSTPQQHPTGQRPHHTPRCFTKQLGIIVWMSGAHKTT